jgi:hypothetical protein
MNNQTQNVHLAEGDRTAVSDRALLEAAAKAAGYPVEPHPNRNATRHLMFILNRNNWNPLTDDGDALRLAVKLGLFWSPELAHFLALERFAGQERDDCYAHRRAIVRAAASLHSVPTQSSVPDKKGVSALSVDQADRKGGAS